ncbi:MAG: Flp pilus assembly complex ATPase component TadA [Gammaproteobacteria bacterium]|nr:Flp pilus assembly complex ATPase component TadA [Gammaproteobacteria bacterium]
MKFNINKVRSAISEVLPNAKDSTLAEVKQLLQQYQSASDEGTVVGFSQLLLSQGYITEEQQLQLLARSLELPLVSDYDAMTLVGNLPSPETNRDDNQGINQSFLKKHDAVYLAEPINLLLTANPESKDVLQYITLEGISPDIKVLSSQGVEQAHQQLAQQSTDQQSFLAELQNKQLDSDSLRALASQAPVINLFNSLVTRAVLEKASDIHIEPHGNSWKVRLRRDGLLLDGQDLPEKLAVSVISRIKILSNLDIAEKRRPQDGKISMRAASKNLDLRVSTLPVIGGESVVLRLLLKESLKFDLTEMGFSSDTLSYLQKDLTQTAGVILLTGPTGSGKTTTLYSFLQQIYDPKLKMITLEDPVEYQFEQINQMQVHSDIGFTFAAGLRSILRQDPDVIMVGEIRDSETAKIALQASMTGHLVFSTVHTNDAASAYARLTDLGIEEYLLNETIISVVAQRLVRLVCSHCAIETKWQDLELTLTNNGDLYQMLKDTAEHYEIKPSIKQANSGCEHCNHTGYLGRAVIAEYLPNSQDIQQLAKDNTFAFKAKAYMKEQGLRSLRQDAALKVLRGETTISELIRVVGN